MINFTIGLNQIGTDWTNIKQSGILEGGLPHNRIMIAMSPLVSINDDILWQY